MAKGNGSAGFDFGSRRELETAPMVVRDPVTGDSIMSYGEPLTLTIASNGHPATKRGQAAFAAAQADLAIEYGDQKPPLEKTEAAVRLWYYHRVVAWTPVDLCGEQRIECNPETVKRVCDVVPWLLEDIAQFVRERHHFFSERSSGSGPGFTTSRPSQPSTTTAAGSPTTGAPPPTEAITTAPS